jgi:uncharacterized DUF497 family protein
MHYDFEWDSVKAQINFAAHGVPFELAQDVLEDPLLVTKPDPRHDDRWISIGEVRGTLLGACWIWLIFEYLCNSVLRGRRRVSTNSLVPLRKNAKIA